MASIIPIIQSVEPVELKRIKSLNKTNALIGRPIRTASWIHPKTEFVEHPDEIIKIPIAV